VNREERGALGEAANSSAAVAGNFYIFIEPRIVVASDETSTLSRLENPRALYPQAATKDPVVLIPRRISGADIRVVARARARQDA